MPAKKEGGERPRGLPRLPPGRHGLSRDFVVENQRGRLAAGMIRVVVSEGYVDTTVSKVVAAAGVSRRTFYNYYSDKEEAFHDVYAQVTDFLLVTMEEAGQAERGWPARVRAQLAAMLETLDANPDLVRFCLAAPPLAGGEVAVGYRAFLEHLLNVITKDRPKRAKTPPPAAEYGVVGGLAALLVAAVEHSDEPRLTALLPEALELVLTPYLGREAAVDAAS